MSLSEYLGVQEEDSIQHHGVKGMKWGVRKQPERSGGSKLSRKQYKTMKKTYKSRLETNTKKAQERYKVQQLAEKYNQATQQEYHIQKQLSKMDPKKVTEEDWLKPTRQKHSARDAYQEAYSKAKKSGKIATDKAMNAKYGKQNYQQFTKKFNTNKSRIATAKFIATAATIGGTAYLLKKYPNPLK